MFHVSTDEQGSHESLAEDLNSNVNGYFYWFATGGTITSTQGAYGRVSFPDEKGQKGVWSCQARTDWVFVSAKGTASTEFPFKATLFFVFECFNHSCAASSFFRV